MTITRPLQEFSSWIYKQWLLFSLTWQSQSPLPPPPPTDTETPPLPPPPPTDTETPPLLPPPPTDTETPPLPPPPPTDTETPPLPPPPPIDTKTPQGAAAQPGQLDLKVGNENMDWASIIVAYCFASAIMVALSFHKLDPKFSPTIHLFSFTISLCFASFFIRHFINSKFQVIARVLYGVGIFLAVTSFFIANTIHFPLWLKIMTWLVYAVSLLLIFASSFVH